MSSYSGRGQWSATAIAAVALLALSFAFGGASREHALRLAVVEIAALPLLVFGLRHALKSGVRQDHLLALGLLAGLAAVPLIQLIPLPPAVWTSLPGREDLTLALSLVGLSPSWMSLSLTPDLTWGSFLALLPPLAAFLGVLAVTREVKQRLVWIFMGATACAVCLGALQLASGSTAFYPWETTAAGNVTGFFANRNHMATLLLTSLPFAAALSGGAMRRGSRRAQTLIWLSALYIGLAVVTLGVIRSRAGLILAGPTLGGAFLAAWVASGRGRPGPAILALAGATTAAVVAVAAFALAPIMARFDTVGAPEGRFEVWPTVAETANAYLPVGSGVGSFDAVYRSVEPLARLDATYTNQVHNEYLQLWLETGWFGIALVIVFLIWWGRRTWTAWRSSPSSEHDLQRAASIAIPIVMLHSVVDYPLRTTTMMVVFALCAALLEGAGSAPTEPPVRRTRRSETGVSQ